MIDITQWRVSIGTFNSNAARSVTFTAVDKEVPYQCCLDNGMYYQYHCHYSAFVWFVSTYYVLNIFVFICLILSGDIETNPGPVVYKKCPECGDQIHNY